MQRHHRPVPTAVLTALIVGLVGVSASPAVAVAPADGTVFVNELHYDNEGTDADEAIELAGPAGTDLTDWSLVLYNGANGAAYNTRALSGTIPDQQGGFGTVAVTYPVNGIQNGSPDGIALVDPAGAVAQFLSYEGSFAAVGGPADGLTSTDIGVREGATSPVGASLRLTGTGSTYGEFTWAEESPSSFGAVNPGQTFAQASTGCDTTITHEIGSVQGTGAASPLDGQPVTVQGVVVGDFQAPGQLGGVYLQDADGDGDPATSDGIFVSDADAPAFVAGDIVRVTGTVDEYYGLTQITAVSAIVDCGDAALPAPAALDLPADDGARERLEGMRISVPEPVTATETYNLARYGELVVSSEGRLYQPTNDGGDDAAEQTLNNQRRLVLDDGSTVQNPAEIPFTTGGVIRLGDTVTDVAGVLSYGFSAWRVQPTGAATVTRTNPRPAAPDAVGGGLRVASYNVLNYFTTIDTPGAVTDTGDDPRGADTQEEFQRQQAKIVAAILELDADVVGLMEIENDTDDTAVDNLVTALNDAAGEQRYAAVEEPDTGDGLFGTDAIKTAMIYQPGVVTPVGAATTTTDKAFDNARLPLAQQFQPTAGGATVTAVVNHFKSKGCGGATGANTDQGDGQGCYNADRVQQAQALVDFIGTLPDENVMIIGDLNSYGEEDPVDVLEAAGYLDLVDSKLAEADQYTYVFGGQAGYLDHALASPQLVARVAGVDIWHINADEARVLDYNTESNPPQFYAADPYRSSDHDPVLVGVTTG